MEVALFLQNQGQIWHLMANTGLVARITLLILLFFSVLSWAIILKKSHGNPPSSLQGGP